MSLGPNFFGKPPPASGAFTVVANIIAKSAAEAAEVKPILLAIQKSANSDAEPDCTVYKVNVADDDETAFIIYEEYKDAAAFVHHCSQPDFLNLKENAHKAESIHLRYFRHYQ